MVTVALATLLQQGGASGEDILGAGTHYDSPFTLGSEQTITVDPPDGTVVLSLGGTTGPTDIDLWEATATGGASLSVLTSVLESGASLSVGGGALEFGATAANGALLSAVGLTAGIPMEWDARLTLDSPGNEMGLSPSTVYSVSFDVDGSNGLFDSSINVFPSFEFDLLDGSGTSVGAGGNATNVLLLLGGAESGTVNLEFVTPPTVDPGPATLVWHGEGLLSADALSTFGSDYARVSGLSMSSVPEPSAATLLTIFASIGLLRRVRKR